jgi:hypothetical protein
MSARMEQARTCLSKVETTRIFIVASSEPPASVYVRDAGRRHDFSLPDMFARLGVWASASQDMDARGRARFGFRATTSRASEWNLCRSPRHNQP